MNDKLILKTKDFQAAANTIGLAVSSDKTAASLELAAKGNIFKLNVATKEFFVSVKFDLEQETDFRAVVDADTFLSLISSITTETFEIGIKDTYITVKTGKSQYKVAMIYEDDKLMTLPIIKIDNVTIEMPIANDVLKSILNVNSKELAKVKNLDVNELQRLYYIDETGCFTFTTGACLNAFTLEKPVKMLLNDRIVKLFKLFDEDVLFNLGYDATPNGNMQAKVSFQTANIYVAALITNDDILLSKVQRPITRTKEYINTEYAVKAVFSVGELSNAINRLLVFSKNTTLKANMLKQPAEFIFNTDELIIKDKNENTEVVSIASGSLIDNKYTMTVNLADIKLVLDSCKNEAITLHCGNHRSIILVRGPISNLIPEFEERGE